MSRSLSASAVNALMAQQTGEAFLLLLTVEHDDLAAAILLTSDFVETVSRGQTYLPFPFSVSLPDDRDDQPPRVSLTIDNVTREIVAALRALTSPPTVSLEVVLGSSPDVVEVSTGQMSLKGAEYDELTVTGELGYEELLDEPWPADAFTPASHPGLF